MKNIHILPTDKPSRLFFDTDLQSYELSKNLAKNNNCSITQNIYITSDEEIKEGDWVVLTTINKLIKVEYNLQKQVLEAYNKNHKKIILTTDQDLIKDGVQAIDDEFLEWFVKNPSCERFEIEYQTTGLKDGIWQYDYKIIIPQEEPKRKIDTCYNFDREIGCVQDICRCEQEEPKQEKLTYTEAAKKDERILNSNMLKQETLLQIANRKLMSNDWLKGAEFGAKWQAERMYSEEEVIAIVEKSRETGLTAEYLFLTEQFKKK
jgi:hypothetical protein